MLLYFAAATYAPLMWDGWLGEHRLFAADTLPLWAQIVGGFLLLEFGVYAWHRTMHNTPFLWRWFHQMHHSAERVDIWGAFYFHPFDMLGWTFVGSLAWCSASASAPRRRSSSTSRRPSARMFQHANIRTPRWLGYS